jgi:hypothetical protein
MASQADFNFSEGALVAANTSLLTTLARSKSDLGAVQILKIMN